MRAALYHLYLLRAAMFQVEILRAALYHLFILRAALYQGEIGEMYPLHTHWQTTGNQMNQPRLW